MSTNCPSCGRPAGPTDKFCPACGKPLNSQAQQVQPSAKVSRTGLRDSLVVIGLIVAVSALFFAFRTPPQTPQPPRQPASQNPGHMDEMPMGMIDSLPQDYNSLVSAGNDFMDQQNFPVAAELYRRALELDPSSSDVRTDYGACLHSMGLPERAIEEFKRVLKEHPEHSIAHYNLGIVYFTMNEADSARLYWTNYLRIDPSGVAADNARQFLKQLQ